jgi:thioredoxin-related protein
MYNSFLLPLLTGILLGSWIFVSAQDNDPETPYINFVTEEAWEEARTLSQEQGKYLMVDAYTDWCGWCKVQDKKTFHHPRVAQFFNENFVAVKINFEEGIGIDLAMKHRVRSYPTLLFFTPEGKLAGRIIGYEADVNKFLKKVEKLRDPANHPPQIGDPNVLDPGFPDFYRGVFGKERKQVKPETVVAWLQQQEDMFTEPVWNVMAMLPMTEEYQDKFLKELPAYQEKFGKEEANKVVGNIVNARYRKAMQEKSEPMMESVLALKHQFDPDPLNETYMRVNYYQYIEDWRKATDLMAQYVQKNGVDDAHNMLNSVAWGIYEKCDDPTTIKAATTWMLPVVRKHPEYMYLDTYAALLFKGGDLEQAEIWANRAIAAGKANDEKVTETEKLLEEIQQQIQDSRQ